jgi:crotonobetainyl-CoA:carnitine CoA-transferase CaiB-like acyl-CoA transferase
LLDSVRVIDLSTEIAGPYCTKLLADAGAEVVKVEPPGGDPLRHWSASGADTSAGDGALFRFLNASKASVVGDLGSPAVRDLVAGADLLVESLAPGELEAHRLQELNPRLVMVSVSPFGRGGPWTDHPATEFTLQAWCGSIASRGTRDRPPIAAGGRLGEWVAGSYAAAAGLGALLGARRNGRGEHVDVSVLDCMSVTMNTYAYVFASFLDWKRAAGPPRTIELPSIEPTSDGFVGFCTITAQQFRDFLVLIERPDLIEDRGLANVNERVKRMDEFLRIVHAWTTRHSTDEIIKAASLLRLPVAPIGNGETVLSMEQFVRRGTFVASADGTFVHPRVPYRISDTGTRAMTPAPALGAGPAPAWEPGAAGTADDSDPVDPLPLEGLRVVDFTAFWAGPAATHLLAALGADVVKIESVQRPDGMRFTSTRPPSVDRWWEWCPVFHGANTGKRSVTLDLTRSEGVELVKRLIAEADAVMENFSPRVMEGFGLDWPVVHQANPRVVMVRMPAFGLDGPWRDRTGFAQTKEPVSGLAWVTGWADGPPLIPRGACDPLAGMHAVVALLVALDEVRRDGRGRLVEMTMVEAALNVAAEQVVERTAYGALLHRSGNRSPVIAPQGLYPCRGEERWLALSVATDEQWSALRAWLGDPAWAAAPELSSREARRAAHDMIDEELGRHFAARDLDEAVESLLAAGVPAAAVVAPTDVVANPQIAARGLLEQLTHPVVGRHGFPAVPFHFLGRPGPWLRRPAPTLGQHNDEVLVGTLGLDGEEVERLRREGVVGERPAGL